MSIIGVDYGEVSGGGGEATEVWTNDPISGISAQSVTIPNVSNYKYFLIYQKFSTTDTTHDIKIGGLSVDDNITSCTIEFSSNTKRTYALTSSGIDIGNCSDGATYSVPLKILAI